MAFKPIHGWEMVIGLEVHAELATRSKIFCPCATTYGAKPNSQCCPVCLGYPGAMPTLNREVVHLAALAGMALHADVAPTSRLDRKHYFYPDLPKAYQISQYDQPLCQGGYIAIDTPAGEKRIGVTRTHIEEDAGKLLHEADETLLDLNRCGVPLIEIVTEPDIRTPEEAADCFRKLRAILSYAGVSHCRMQEGNLRCDVNLSIRKPGEPFGVRTEMKNLNSFISVQKACEAEYARQVAAIEAGETIYQETRRFDQATGNTFSMRRKETMADYRFFPEPDVPPITLTAQQLAAWRSELPRLPDERRASYMADFGLTAYAAAQLVSSRAIADWFESAAALTSSPQTLANLLITEVFRHLDGEDAPVMMSPADLARLADLVDSGDVSNNAAKTAIAETWGTDETPEDYILRHDLRQISDAEVLRPFVIRAIAENPKMVAQYYGGKESVKRALMGAAMRLTGGKANAAVLMKLMDESLDK